MSLKLAIIGFGEVASIFSHPLVESGAELAVYDVLLKEKDGEDTLRQRAGSTQIRFCSMSEAVDGAVYVISTVTTQKAREVARDCAALLKPGQAYVDLNSTAPSVKVEMDQTIRGSGADFVEGAILGAVGATGVKTHILTCGKRGREVAERLTALGLNVSFYHPDIGKASTFKMLRSIFSKGLEAIILELLISGKRAGIHQDLWRDISTFMTENPFEKVASNWVRTHATAFERRYFEMVQVRETLQEIGMEPVMTSGTEAFFKRSTSLGLGEAFSKKPDSMDAVIDFMEKRLGAT
ncbi:MAG: NAD(P)-dependent oxidoreductase [Deltaproteobacteria bacterium]|nr:NAD(P)-dependent oxidoreductase [Deltaproteobacteria bacterium]MBW2153793.1 NAD(P)-dependent oxidoreductase [Deltaproteobacteria bacterium]